MAKRAKPLMFYDVGVDEMVPLTQKHLDHLLNVAKAYGMLCQSFDKVRSDVRNENARLNATPSVKIEEGDEVTGIIKGVTHEVKNGTLVPKNGLNPHR